MLFLIKKKKRKESKIAFEFRPYGGDFAGPRPRRCIRPNVIFITKLLLESRGNVGFSPKVFFYVQECRSVPELSRAVEWRGVGVVNCAVVYGGETYGFQVTSLSLVRGE